MPPLSVIRSVEIEEIPATGDANFRIIESEIKESESIIVLPDASVCPDVDNNQRVVTFHQFLHETDARFIQINFCRKFMISSQLLNDFNPKPVIAAQNIARSCYQSFHKILITPS